MIAARQPVERSSAPSSDDMPELVSLERSVERYRDAAQADNTRLAYRKQWDAFTAWCSNCSRPHIRGLRKGIDTGIRS
jgi:hypothetical protein